MDIYLHILFFLVSLWLALMLSLFVYEVGHLLAFKLIFGVKNNKWGVIIGEGNSMINKDKIIINIIPSDSQFIMSEELELFRAQKIIILLGGFLANLLCIIVVLIIAKYLYILDDRIYSYYLGHKLGMLFELIVLSNIYRLVVNLVPFHKQKRRSYISDGYKILKILRK